MKFRGWPAEAIEFFEGLEADNSKAYWQSSKAVYESKVVAPMQALLAELEPEFGVGKIFRPYRDVRFSKDKTPYKTAIGATLVRGGYVQMSAAGLGAGCGMYVMASDQLDRFRTAIDDDVTGGQLSVLVASLQASGIKITAHDVLKTAPRGYPNDHPRIELLRNKGLIAWREWPAGAWLGRATAKARVVDFFSASGPVMTWLDTNVGPSDLPTR